MTEAREKVLERREQVKELYFIKGYSIAKTADSLGWTIPTIWNDINNIREEFAATIEKKDVKEHIISIMLRNKQVVTKAWQEYETAKYTRDRLDALRLIKEYDREYLDHLERFGIIIRPSPKKVDAGQQILDAYQEIRKQWIEENSHENSIA